MQLKTTTAICSNTKIDYKILYYIYAIIICSKVLNPSQHTGKTCLFGWCLLAHKEAFKECIKVCATLRVVHIKTKEGRGECQWNFLQGYLANYLLLHYKESILEVFQATSHHNTGLGSADLCGSIFWGCSILHITSVEIINAWHQHEMYNYCTCKLTHAS